MTTRTPNRGRPAIIALRHFSSTGLPAEAERAATELLARLVARAHLQVLSNELALSPPAGRVSHAFRDDQ
jgi:hypothetical protein